MSGSGWSSRFYTDHRTGKVKAEQKKNSASEKMRNFLPPYGDGTFMLKDWTKELRFSPPYGDKLK